MKLWLRHILSVLVLASGLSISGCVSKQVTPDYKPKLGVAQNSDGIVTFAITTRADYVYAIYYEDPTSRAWKLVPGCDHIKGTGEQVEIEKRFNSRGPLPAFTVRHTKIN